MVIRAATASQPCLHHAITADSEVNMRPGPGLVVMALAFVSVARRGGTSQSNVLKFGLNSDSINDNEAGYLAEINPWLSACDVANPVKAPDLQGFCSGNDTILPNHWINEGPGPPVCPPSCVKLPNSEFFGKANSHLNMRDKRIFYEKQQCLEYLNDNKESSPEQICRKQPRDILNALHVLRLRSCCEKSISSSLHNEAMLSVLDGGEECVKILKQLIDTDGIASRITCGLNEILFRYDCRQIYSIKHGCNDCKEAYRRWVCSTLIPNFVEVEDIQKKHSISSRATAGKLKQTREESPLHARLRSDNFEETTDSKLTKRAKRQSEQGNERVRVRPCLGVCQTVEEHCPYLLPGDRAPGYNTQYAGEPTFLCMDPNIAETGEQLMKSNNGPASCCYQYCSQKSVYEGLCTFCDLTVVHNAINLTVPDVSLSESKIKKYENPKTKNEIPPQTCQLVPGLSLTTSRCEIPYYASSTTSTFGSLNSHSKFTLLIAIILKLTHFCMGLAMK